MITEAAERGADLSQDGELWRLMVTESSPWSRSAPATGPRPAAVGGVGTVGSVDLRDAGDAGLPPVGRTVGSPVGGAAGGPVEWQPLHPALASQLDGDPSLQRQLVALGVVSVSGPLLYGSSEVAGSLQAMTGQGVSPATALTLAGQAAEATRSLAALLSDLLSDAGHIVTPGLRDLLVGLTLGVMRDTLAKELDAVR
jgi:hypothetical protein